MIRRPTKAATPTAAQALAMQKSDFTAEGAPAPAAVPAPVPPRAPAPAIAPPAAHGPAARRRWPR